MFLVATTTLSFNYMPPPKISPLRIPSLNHFSHTDLNYCIYCCHTLALQYLNLSEFDDDSFQSVSFLGHFSHPFKSCIGSNSHTIRWMTFGGRIIAHKYVSRAQFPDCLLDHPLRILFLSDIRLQGDLCHLGHWRCPHF